jgi:serine/threonine protein kinase
MTPAGPYIDSTNSFLYITDLAIGAFGGIRKIDLATAVVTTLINGPPLINPISAAFDVSGSLFISDSLSSKIFKLIEAPLLPACGDGRFHHVALTQGDGTPTARKTYLDGQLVSSTTGMTYSLPAAGGSLRIGSDGLGGGIFSGLLSDLRIYNRALPASEIEVLMLPPTFTIPPAPPAAPASLTGTIVACTLLLLAGAGMYVARERRQRRLRRLKAEAAATPDFKINFFSGDLTSATAPTTLNPVALAAPSGGAPAATPLSSSPPSGALITEVPWLDLVPDLRHAPMSGGFGTVFVARWVSKKRLVAVKVPKLAALSREQSRAAVQMLLAEAQGLARASDGGVNSHVVQVFGVAQGRANGWAAALQVARDAEARHQARKARTLERRSKAAAASSSPNAAATSGGSTVAQLWRGGDSTQGGGTNSNTLMSASSEGASGSDPGGTAGVCSEGAGGVSESESEDEGGAQGNERRAAEAAAALKLAAENSGGDAPAAPFLFGLIMSFEAGGALDARLFPRRGGRASWPLNMVDKLRVLKEAAAGLYGLHAIGMVHGDLKPENVLLSGKADAPSVRLADFGLATVKSGASRASRISTIAAAEEKRGTWPYMAPEMYRSRTAPPAAASRSTDVYAFGTLMHEVLAARVPWREYAEMDRLGALQRGENLDAALLPKDTPPGVAALVARCLALNRAQRPRTTEVLAVLEQAHENAVSGHFDIFLSYAWGARSARKPLADELYLALRAAGLRVWQDELEMGLDLAASMSEGIAKSDVVVMLVSPSYAASGPCMFEARAAAAAGKPIVACCAEPGFWRTWLAADGTGAPALPDDHELVALARLKTQLFADLGAASAVNWSAESVPPAERKKLVQPEALPRLLTLVVAARGKAAAAAGSVAAANAIAASSAATSSAAHESTQSSAFTPSSGLRTTSQSEAAASAAAASFTMMLEASQASSAAVSALVLAPHVKASASAATWTRHRDGGDSWFVSSSGESAWDLPPGAVVEGPDSEPSAKEEQQHPAAQCETKRKRLKGRVVRGEQVKA